MQCGVDGKYVKTGKYSLVRDSPGDWDTECRSIEPDLDSDYHA